MKWGYKFSEASLREFKKIDRANQKRILDYLNERIVSEESPRRFGKPLRKGFAGYWCYRVGDYRILCEIQDQELLVLVLKVGHRRHVYQ